MQRDWIEDEDPRRPRRNSGSFSRRGSLKKEPEKKLAPSSSSSTPKKVAKPQNLDFCVTGRQLGKRYDRANSLPAPHHRRQSVDSLLKSKRSLDSPKKIKNTHAKTRDTSLEYDTSLDLSQVSDYEEANLKYKTKPPPAPPKRSYQKAQSHRELIQRDRREVLEPKRSISTRECASKNSSMSYKHGISTEYDYSSMSPECSGPSSGDSVAGAPGTLVSPRSQDLQDSSFYVSTCEARELGEWGHFWANYNNSLARVPISRYYDQCPTPYRSDDVDLTDFEFPADASKKRSPDSINNINAIIRNEGLRLTPRETQHIIKCAHILGNVLTKAMERQSKDYSQDKVQEIGEKNEKETKKKTMTLNLKETVLPVEVKAEKGWETVTTQTDISLPNTRTAPIIFENILRQLSMSSLDDRVPEADKNSDKK